MKNTALAKASAALCAACLLGGLSAAEGEQKPDGTNPIVKTRFSPDPAGVVVDDTFYLFAGHDAPDARWYKMFDWQVLRTKDMVHWEDLGCVMSVRETFPWAKDDGAWASQAIRRDGRWYWYVAVFRKGGDSCVAVATAEDVKGPWKDAVGGPLVEGRGYIDPTVFIDDDGQAWLFWGNCGGDPGCWYAPLKANMVELAGEVKPVPGLMDEKAFGKPLKKKQGAGSGKPIDTNFEEAPWIYKVGDTYYLEYAAGGVPEHWAYSWAKSIHGPWHYGGRIMDEAKGTGTIHGGSVFFKGEWYLLYHNATLPGGADCRRSACIERYTRNSDGSIPHIRATKEGVSVRGGTERVSLDSGWTFTREGGEPRKVDVPHDWSIETAPDEKSPTGKAWGFYAAGKAEYARTFSLAKDDLSRDLSLVFDGVLWNCRVSVNGGEWVRGSRYGYTGFRVSLAGKAREGENTVRVEIDNSAVPACRWYMGSGIYRSVWLEKRDWPYLEPGSVDVSTQMWSPMVSWSQKPPEGHTLAHVSVTGTLVHKDGRREPKLASFPVLDPELWTPDSPRLYEVDFCGEKVKYGIREVKWSAESGFLLNGRPVELHGACVHHDHGPLGAASWPEAERRKALQLKRAGFNAVRTSHNPVSEAFIEACDEVGLLVMDDMFDGRQQAKTNGDYCGVFDEDWRKDVEWIVRRDRVHPSVVMWSVGNEVLERNEPRAAETTKAMRDFIRTLDTSRPVTQALCLWGERWENQDAMAANLDIVGYNYLENLTEGDHERLPNRVIVYTETYPKDAAAVWRRILRHPYVVGEFVWTGIDYLGECGIGRNFYVDREKWGEHWHDVPQFPWHGAYCGDIDLVGTRKPISHYRETLWNENAPTYVAVREPDGWKGQIRTTAWSVWPTYDHWTFAGWEGKEVTVEVYSRRPRVRLLLNGEKVAESGNSAENAWKCEFKTAYRPGELVAEGLDESGKAVEMAVLRTAGEPAEVRFSKERIGRLSYVTAEVVDKDGTVCPYADREVEFKGRVLATCSGDLTDSVPATSPRRRTWLGRALGVVLE